MPNFIVSYDLNGPRPSHKEMDAHLSRIGSGRARLLETVWWINHPGTAEQLRDQITAILRPEDRLLVCECTDAAWQRLLVNGDALANAWQHAARRAA